MFCLVKRRRKSIEYTLDSNGPEEVAMNEETSVHWTECCIRRLKDDADIRVRLRSIEHKCDMRYLKRAENPFAEGGQRISYHAKLVSTDRLNNIGGWEKVVMKRFKTLERRDRHQDYLDLMETQYVAAFLATEFNKVSPRGSKEIQFLKVRKNFFFCLSQVFWIEI